MKKAKLKKDEKIQRNESLWNWFSIFICSDYWTQLSEVDKEVESVEFRKLVDKHY